MKKSYRTLLTLLIFVSINCFCQNNLLSYYKTSFNKDLKKWALTFKDFRLSEFKLIDTLRFEDLPFGNTDNLKEFFKLYKPALTFSNDSSHFIDIYSYWLNLEKHGNKIVANTDIDQAVSLCDIKNKKWLRIFFCGYSTRIDEVIWTSKTTFILAGSEMSEGDKFNPKILIGDIKNRMFLIYKDDLCISNKIGYSSPKLKRLNIQDE